MDLEQYTNYYDSVMNGNYTTDERNEKLAFLMSTIERSYNINLFDLDKSNAPTEIITLYKKASESRDWSIYPDAEEDLEDEDSMSL